MARGNSRAQSEAGTIERSQTLAYRIKAATDLLRNLTTGGINRENADLAEQVLNRPRSNETEYDIVLSRAMDPAGKLNMMDATINGKEIGRNEEGAFDATFTKRRGSSASRADFKFEERRANVQEGFIFAKDENNEVFAIPHKWDVNDPQGTVGVFANDTITIPSSRSGDRVLTVIGTFDNTKRGLNLAAAAAGESIGRPQGVKQTATILTRNPTIDADRMTAQNRTRRVPDQSAIPYAQFDSDLIRSLKQNEDSGRSDGDWVFKKRNN